MQIANQSATLLYPNNKRIMLLAFSPWVGGEFNFPTNLHYSQTLMAACEGLIEFLFPTNLHYSQTSNSNISLKGLILSPVLRASAYTNATTYKSLKDGVRKEIYLYIKQSPTWLSINFTQVFIYYQTLFKRQAAIVPVFNH